MAAKYQIDHDLQIETTGIGYDCELVDESQRNNYTCVICTFLARDAVETPCDHLFCQYCLTSWNEEKKGRRLPITCPVCNHRYSTQEVRRAGTINRVVRSGLPVYCKQRTEGCHWTGTIDDFEEHAGKCEFITRCPNEKCNVKRITKAQLAAHLESCPFRKIDCPYKEVGCIVKVASIELKEHLENFANHHLKFFQDKWQDEREQHRKTQNELEVNKKLLEETQNKLRITEDSLNENLKKLKERNEELRDIQDKLEIESLQRTHETLKNKPQITPQAQKLQENVQSLQEPQDKIEMGNKLPHGTAENQPETSDKPNSKVETIIKDKAGSLPKTKESVDVEEESLNESEKGLEVKEEKPSKILQKKTKSDSKTMTSTQRKSIVEQQLVERIEDQNVTLQPMKILYTSKSEKEKELGVIDKSIEELQIEIREITVALKNTRGKLKSKTKSLHKKQDDLELNKSLIREIRRELLQIKTE